MAEIRSDQYQNGDKQKDAEIKRDVKLYITNSYVIDVFLCQRMFNTMTVNHTSGKASGPKGKITASVASLTQQMINILDTDVKGRVRGKVIPKTELLSRLAQFTQTRE